MSETYCGRNCETCAQKEALGCPGGCGLAAPRVGECPIADCCREKGHASCATCTAQDHCFKLRDREEMPQRRYEKRCADAARQDHLVKIAPVFAKWLRVLFWSMIVSQIFSILTNEDLMILWPWMEWPGKIVGMVCSVLLFVVLFKLSPYEKQYRTAACCHLATIPISLLTIALGLVAGEWTTLLALLAAVAIGILTFYADYKEYYAHAAVLVGLDDELSEKWIRLWDWVKYSLFALGVGLVIGMIVGLIGLIGVLAGAVGLVIVAVRNYIYIYRMAQAFRALANRAES